MGEPTKKYGQGVLTGVLITIIVCLIAFIVYDKVLSNDNDNKEQVENNQQTENNDVNKDNEQETKEEKVTLTDTEKKDLLNKIDDYNTDIRITQNYPIADINSLDNSVKLNFLYGKTINSVNENFTKDDLKTVANNYFYSGFTFTNENIICSYEKTPLYTYNNSTGIYTFNDGHGHGGGEYNRTKAYYVDGIYNESTKIYTFDIKVLYGETCSDVCGPITKYYSDNKLSNLVYKVEEELKEFDDVYSIVKDKLPTTKYNFYKNSNGKFVLKSVQ